MQLSIFGLPETTVPGFHGTWVIVLAFRTLQAGFPLQVIRMVLNGAKMTI